jgi:hypothetical protein
VLVREEGQYPHHLKEPAPDITIQWGHHLEDLGHDHDNKVISWQPKINSPEFTVGKISSKLVSNKLFLGYVRIQCTFTLTVDN